MDRPRRDASLRARLLREHVADLAHRSRQVLLAAALTGVLVGLAVAAFEWVTGEVLLGAVLDAPLGVQLAAPAVGLVVGVVILRLGRTSAATADEYVRSFHDPARRLRLRDVPVRIGAAVATLGLGGPLGYEGPSLYAGAAIGSSLQRRLGRLFGPGDARVLLVAGAAAGVAAIFKAPLTGLVFALEVPYHEDLARRMLLPAAISAASSYVVFAGLVGTEPILPVAGQPPFNLVDLGGAAAIGLACGLLARVFVAIVTAAKRWSGSGHPWAFAAVGGAAVTGSVALGHWLGGTELVLGPGYDAVEWALEPDRAVLAVVALGTIRVVGTVAVVLGGGTGGLFIPLVIQGALVGRAFGGLFETETSTLFPLVGMAAFLGAGYRVPLAAVVFVAEATGRPGFVVPGLIAAVVSKLVMGRASISPYQSGRASVGDLERRLELPVAAAMDTEARTVPPDATVEELFWQHLVGARQASAAVVDGGTFLGLVFADDLAEITREEWAGTPVADVMRTGVEVAAPEWPLRDAVRLMDRQGTDCLAVCTDDRYAGILRASDLVRLDDIVSRTDPQS